MNNDQLNSAISAHSRWKSRLLLAIEKGTCDVSAADARKEDQCQFGKWLKETPGLRRDPHYNKVYDLHKQFHEAAAKVLDLAVAGKTDDAKLAMSMGSPFLAASSALTHEIVQWRDQK